VTDTDEKKEGEREKRSWEKVMDGVRISRANKSEDDWTKCWMLFYLAVAKSQQV
jgi:hypothetical protein